MDYAIFFRFLIPRFAIYSTVLTNLQQKSGYVGGALLPLAASAFSYFKNKLCDSSVSHPRRGFIFHLATDACEKYMSKGEWYILASGKLASDNFNFPSVIFPNVYFPNIYFPRLFSRSFASLDTQNVI